MRGAAVGEKSSTRGEGWGWGGQPEGAQRRRLIIKRLREEGRGGVAPQPPRPRPGRGKSLEPPARAPRRKDDAFCCALRSASALLPIDFLPPAAVTVHFFPAFSFPSSANICIKFQISIEAQFRVFYLNSPHQISQNHRRNSLCHDELLYAAAFFTIDERVREWTSRRRGLGPTVDTAPGRYCCAGPVCPCHGAGQHQGIMCACAVPAGGGSGSPPTVRGARARWGPPPLAVARVGGLPVPVRERGRKAAVCSSSKGTPDRYKNCTISS